MHHDALRESARAFGTLAELVYRQADSEAVLDAIVSTAVSVVPGADHACISTLDGEMRLNTRAASDDVARLMDRLETEAAEGPCLDSITADSVQHSADIRTHAKWPTLTALTLERTPVRGMIGYQLLTEAGGPSAFNVFSDRAGALDERAVDIGAVLAAFASVVLSAIERHENAEHLRRGLHSNREIGKAVGLLMAAHDIGDDEAFDLLRTASSHTNNKLYLVAEGVTSSHRAGRRGDSSS